MQEPTTSFKTRILSIFAVWIVLGAAFAIFTPFTTEAGESIADVRGHSFVKTPLVASLGLASLITQSRHPAQWLAIPTLLFLAGAAGVAICLKRKSHFYGAISLQALLILASLIQAARFVSYWNEHGHS